MHQAGWPVKHISDELESELFQDFLRSTIVGVMPGVDLRQPQLFPAVFERAERCFSREPLPPAALHEMEPDFEIRLAGRIQPQPKPAAADELAIAVIEQRLILNATDLSRSISARSFSPTWALVSSPRESMSAVTAGLPHNSIARGRSSICHDRATRRPVLNFSTSAVTAAEDRYKSYYQTALVKRPV